LSEKSGRLRRAAHEIERLREEIERLRRGAIRAGIRARLPPRNIGPQLADERYWAHTMVCWFQGDPNLEPVQNLPQ
jgi:hypothetical protein